MATLTNLKGSETLDSKSKKYTFSTNGTYVNGDIELTVTAKDGSAITPTSRGASTSTSLNGTTLTVARSVTPTVSAGWIASGTAGTVTITGTVPTQAKIVTPSISDQIITPDSGNLLSSVTVKAISPRRTNGEIDQGMGKDSTGIYAYFNYGWWPQYSTTGKGYIYLYTSEHDAIGTAAKSEVLSGKTFTSSNGVKISGTMPNNGAINATITTQNGTYTIPAGYTTGGTVKATLSTGAYGDNITVTDTTTYPELIKTTGAFMTKKRIQKVKVVAGQTFQIEVPNGSATNTIVFTFTVDANNNVTIT